MIRRRPRSRHWIAHCHRHRCRRKDFESPAPRPAADNPSHGAGWWLLPAAPTDPRRSPRLGGRPGPRGERPSATRHVIVVWGGLRLLLLLLLKPKRHPSCGESRRRWRFRPQSLPVAATKGTNNQRRGLLVSRTRHSEKTIATTTTTILRRCHCRCDRWHCRYSYNNGSLRRPWPEESLCLLFSLGKTSGVVFVSCRQQYLDPCPRCYRFLSMSSVAAEVLPPPPA
mmetsp:Transcript_14253/g.32808  ORF Transcript_14253/g.32808 Transcript_14253/m.32808 type:complete len:226 (-) Transcript_14253:154-831(-)